MLRYPFLLLVFMVASASWAQVPDENQILANLKYRIPQLRDAEVVLGAIEPSEFSQFHQGTFTVNGRESYKFLITGDPARLLLLMTDPIDMGLPSESIAVLIEEEARQEVAMANDRHEALNKFAAGMPARGPADAPVTIYEFSDFQCPYCARASTIMEELLERNPDDVRFVFLHLPLSNHDWAKPAAVAAVCAARQDHDAFWLLHDQYFENQRSIVKGIILDQSREWLEGGASLDMDAWETCANDEESADNQSAVLNVEVSIATAERFGVTGTPAFFVNGHFMGGVQPVEVFEELIQELKSEQEGAR